MKNKTKLLIKIVKKASKLAQSDFFVKDKDNGGDLVTSVDFAVEDFLIKKLKLLYPGYEIISEESNPDQKIRKNCFVIDPIDGTINFANGLPFWSIQCASIKNWEIDSAVIFMPQLNRLYYADETGAYLNGKKINVKIVPIKNCLFDMKIDENNLISRIKYKNNLRKFGAASIRQAFLASGEIHGVVQYKDLNLWDFLPGKYILEKAGAQFYEIDKYNVISASNEFLEELKTIIKK